MLAHSFRTAATASVFLLLGACGGGGGGGSGVGSTPAPPTSGPGPGPTPEPSPNSLITDLKASQSFAIDSSSSQVAINLDSRVTGAGTASAKALTISYNAATGSYTVAAPDRSTSFAPAERVSFADGESRYQRNGATSSDYLTLVTTPYTGTGSNRYVGLGYLQRNSVSGRVQDIGFDTFAYGLETPASAVPRTGRASWAADVFGLYTAPDQTPRTIQGRGDFTVDFASGHFTTSTPLEQYDFLTGASVTGGGIFLESRGRLGSGNSFSGAASFEGTLGAVSGELNGRFYGPGAEEIGAAFRADNAAGATLVGSLTGQRKSATTAVNFTLNNIVTEQISFSFWSILNQALTTAGPGYFVQSPLIGQTTLRTDGTIASGSPSSDMASITTSEANRVASARPDFASYQQTFGGIPARVDLYRPANPALVLTYANFGSWEQVTPAGAGPVTKTAWFVYGLPTQRELLSRRTGTATYEGTAWGTAGAEGAGRYDVGGTSRFDVDFTGQRFSGTLALNATPIGGQGTATLGTWQFGAPLSYGLLATTALNNGTPGNPGNVITPAFFGPAGEEIAATFSIATGAMLDGRNVTVAGATVAKRR